MKDENEDSNNTNKSVKRAYQVRSIANGQYGRGTNAWNPDRIDSASKKRDY